VLSGLPLWSLAAIVLLDAVLVLAALIVQARRHDQGQRGAAGLGDGRSALQGHRPPRWPHPAASRTRTAPQPAGSRTAAPSPWPQPRPRPWHNAAGAAGSAGGVVPDLVRDLRCDRREAVCGSAVYKEAHEVTPARHGAGAQGPDRQERDPHAPGGAPRPIPAPASHAPTPSRHQPAADTHEHEYEHYPVPVASTPRPPSDQLVADTELVARVRRCGGIGPVWQELAAALDTYARPIIRAWILSN